MIAGAELGYGDEAILKDLVHVAWQATVATIVIITVMAVFTAVILVVQQLLSAQTKSSSQAAVAAESGHPNRARKGKKRAYEDLENGAFGGDFSIREHFQLDGDDSAQELRYPATAAAAASGSNMAPRKGSSHGKGLNPDADERAMASSAIVDALLWLLRVLLWLALLWVVLLTAAAAVWLAFSIAGQQISYEVDASVTSKELDRLQGEINRLQNTPQVFYEDEVLPALPWSVRTTVEPIVDRVGHVTLDP